MTTEEKLDRLTDAIAAQGQGMAELRMALAEQGRNSAEETARLRATLAEQARNISDIAGVVNALAGSIVAHDNQIEALIKLGEAHDLRLKELAEMIANTEKQWQAYLRTLPRQ